MIFIPFCLASLMQQPSGGALTYEWQETHPSIVATTELLAAPDLDLDGREDWIAYNGVEILAISGIDGRQIWSRSGLQSDQVQLSDLNGDSSTEVVVTREYSNGNDGRVVCLDAHSGVTLWESAPTDPQAYRTERTLLADTNGDGRTEILVTNLGEYSASPGSIYCLSSRGHLIWKHELDTPKARYAHVTFEDLDSDGIIDVIVSEPTYRSVDRKKREGRIMRLDAATGDIAWEFLGGERGALLGEELQFSDLNADGVAEILSLQPSARVNQQDEAGMVTCITADGVGLWRVYGWEAEQRLGEISTLGDGNRDGWSDLYLGLPSTSSEHGAIVAIDGQSGAELWRAEDWLDPGKRFGRGLWFSSGGSASHDWIVVDVGPDIRRLHRGQAGVDFRHAGTGARLRAVTIAKEVGTFYSKWVVRDLDGDGEPEAAIAHSNFVGGEGFVASVNAKNGLMWLREGKGVGQSLLVTEPNLLGAAKVITSQITPRIETHEAGELRAFDFDTGNERWFVTGALVSERLGFTIEEAVDGDGMPIGLIEVRSRDSYSGNGVRYYSPGTGELAWAAVSGNPEARDFNVVHAPDSDQNGRRRSLIQDGSNFRQVGEYARVVPCLTASSQEVSVAQGGQVQLYLDFSAQASYYEYRILGSSRGVAESALGDRLVVPLYTDKIFYMSKQLDLPEGVIPAAEGSLNAFGKTTVRVNFRPGQVPASAVGRSLHFCAVAREPWGEWERCSVPIEVTFVP